MQAGHGEELQVKECVCVRVCVRQLTRDTHSCVWAQLFAIWAGTCVLGRVIADLRSTKAQERTATVTPAGKVTAVCGYKHTHTHININKNHKHSLYCEEKHHHEPALTS